jgi:perosamine synthetase
MIPIARPIISQKEINSVIRVLKSGHLVAGKNVKKFEENFSEYNEVKYAIATSNGTTALHTALLATGIKPGDEVITTPFSFIASSNCILYVGAKPVFVDISNRTFNIDYNKIEEKITEQTKALLIVHLFGQPCEMEAIIDLCKDNDLLLIEDACQAHGAEYKGKKVGSFGDVGCFSFYATKNMMTGEGGMITTNSSKLAERCRLLRDHGQEKKYIHTNLGFNFRMTDFQAAIGLEQLKKLDKWNSIRIKNAEFLTKKIKKIDGLIPPFVVPKVKHVFNQYTIRTKKISNVSLSKKLAKEGIETKIYYPVPIHKQKIYRKLGFNAKLPETELAAKEVLSLPVYPSLSKKELKFIVEKLRSTFKAHG